MTAWFSALARGMLICHNLLGEPKPRHLLLQAVCQAHPARCAASHLSRQQPHDQQRALRIQDLKMPAQSARDEKVELPGDIPPSSHLLLVDMHANLCLDIHLSAIM